MEAVEPSKELTLVERIRNMWQFANLAQWIFIFGKAVKIDENIDVEVRGPDLTRNFLRSAWSLLLIQTFPGA
jgi:hypothetical protein